MKTERVNNKVDNKTSEQFYDLLLKMRGIDSLSSRIHKLLCDMQRDLSENAKIVIYMYFSLLGDGNTRISLDTEKLNKRWKEKWDSLIVLDAGQGEKRKIFDEWAAEFASMIQLGVRDILSLKDGNLLYSHLFERRALGELSDSKAGTKPFVICKDKNGEEYMYAAKYFDDRCIIEERAQLFFRASVLDEEEASQARKAFSACVDDLFPLKESEDQSVFKLEDRQIDAVLRGLKENLIITGGPGTGKTTVICFMLWQLLSDHPELLSWDIRLAAPSGKAADRMRESLLESIEKFDDKKLNHHQKLIKEKIRSLESATIHRLLNYNPDTNQFRYNEETPFSEKSIFIIDEASMIDIDLFAKFMSALPVSVDENGCRRSGQIRLYILGDADQLPSVEAGAVLGEMLQTERAVVKLDKSKRFNENSEVGRLSQRIQRAKNSGKLADADNVIFGEKAEFYLIDEKNAEEKIVKPKKKIKNTKEEGRVQGISISVGTDAKSEALETKRLKQLIAKWCDCFYVNTELMETARKVNPLDPPESQQEILKKLWSIAENARILTAENRGRRGIDALNGFVRAHLAQSMKDAQKTWKNGPNAFDGFFVGELLMLTKNLQNLRLYNGDSGIVVGEPDSSRLHLLLKKVRTRENNGQQGGNYVFYPLSLLPQDSLVSAFAITIHKSQGSGYPHVMMFLPTTSGHPLLNNQIVYTGVTRTKNGSLTIVSDSESFRTACETVIVRDTGISF